MRDDRDLLRDYQAGSEPAFRELVRRHIDFVYSTALRRVGGDAHLARDVAQEVFIALAKHAEALTHQALLAGWLFTTTRFAASHVVRRERRRRERERKADIMDDITTAAEPEWHRLRPQLEAVLDELSTPDRDALLLRFFTRLSFLEIGARLALSEDAARRRVDRALDKLRIRLGKRGIDSSATAVAVMLTSQAVAAAPAGIEAAVAAAALAAPGLSAVSVVAAVQLMSTTKLTVAAVASLAALAFAVRETSLRASTDAERGALDAQTSALLRSTDELRDRVTAAEKAARGLNQDLEQARRALAETENGPRASAPPRSDPTAAGREFLAQHPEARRAVIADQKGLLAVKYAPLFKSLNLTPAQADELTDLMATGRSIALSVTTPDGGSLRLEVPAERQASRDEMMTRARALLGEEGFKRIDAFERTAFAMEATVMVNSALYRTAPLTAGQMEQLAQTLARTNSNYGTRDSLERGTFDWPKAISEAKSFLTPPQLDVLGLLQKSSAYRDAVNQLQRGAAPASTRPASASR